MFRLDTSTLGLIALTTAAAWLAMFLLLPHRHGGVKPVRVYAIGAASALIAVALILGLLESPAGGLGGLEGLLTSGFFYTFALLALVGALLMTTARDPIHSALWFAVVVLSASGLSLLAGAQFLAAGTVIVYAGAIVVTFLFVIMLAQSHGRAIYDRMARMPALSALTSALMLGGLLVALVAVRSSHPADITYESRLRTPAAILQRMSPETALAVVLKQAVPETSKLPTPAEPGAPTPHLAGLGATLFTDHLMTVEVIGLLLFVALIGAVAIATPRAPIRPSRPTGSDPSASIGGQP